MNPMVSATSDRVAVHATRAPVALGPYRHAVITGWLVFCSGQLPIRRVSVGLGGATTRHRSGLTR